jgi:threonyl-tRNA synthetase
VVQVPKIDWDKKEDRERFWHSCSHIMAEAVQKLYPEAKFSIGPAIEEGFYYDFDVEKPFTPGDLKKIEKEMERLAGKNEKFERREISIGEARKLFRGQEYKLELIEELHKAGQKKASIYSSGSFTDLCRGPHLENSGAIKAIRLLKVSGAYWRGNEKNKMLQRIYGIAFPEKRMLDEWAKQREEAEKRNHIKLGKELGLFSMHDESPGSVFFHGRGMVIWNELVQLWRKEHLKRGYEELRTPVILKKELWERSGHWDHYKENMYFTKVDDEDYAIKPMNCPGGIIIFQAKRHSYRDLPIRAGEMGTVHRHELSGVLNGLFRVRKFTQDDAHIFCTEEQITDEIIGIIDLVDHFYTKIFGFRYHIELSTRPENAMGEKKSWDLAEKALKKALEKKKIAFKLNEGEGAFYGPKIDFHIKDSLGRTWQCATIQLDFAMPEKFNLHYIGKDDKPHRPVMIHRVIYGSMERFIGILIEHYGGAFPLWLSPVQVALIPIADRHVKHAAKIMGEMLGMGIRAELDSRNETVSCKVREWQKQKANYVLVMGDKEVKNGTVTVRSRAGKVLGEKKAGKFMGELLKEIDGGKRGKV